MEETTKSRRPSTTTRPRGKNAKKMSAVVTSAWQAADGDIGCFFMNISEQPQQFEYEIDLAKFELESLGTYSVTKHELGQINSLAKSNAGRLTGTDSLDGAKVMMIEFTPISANAPR